MNFTVILLGSLFISMSSPVTIPTIDAPVIDGVMNVDEWSDAFIYKDLYFEIVPILGNEPSDSMHIYIGHDKENIYVLFNAFQDTSTIIQKNALRDQMGAQDMVALILDPMGNKQEEYFIMLALPNVITDFRKTMTNGSLYMDMTWNCRCNFKTLITDYGYIVELALPLDNFRRQQGDTLNMNINFFRRIESGNMELSYFDIEDMSSQGELDALHPIILTDVENKRESIDIMPYGTYGAILNDNTYSSAGFDARVPLGSTSVMNFAFNPDFSQLEGDPLRIDFNSEYALYYSEYRPFFTEERGVFQTDNSLYYSRAIINPYIAGRYTVKDPNNQAGIIFAYDQADSNIGNNDALASVMKYKRKISDHYLGALFTARRDLEYDYNNAVLSADAMFDLPANITVDINGGVSYTDSIINDKYGYYHDMNIRYITNEWIAVLHTAGISPQFFNDLGYITYKDNQYAGGYVSRIWWFSNDYIQKIELAENFGANSQWNNTWRFITQTRDSIEGFSSTQLRLYMLKKAFAQISYNYNRDFYDNVFLNYQNIQMFIDSRINNIFSYSIAMLYGYNIDYNYARIGQYKYIVANIFCTPLPTLSINAGVFLNNHSTDPDVQALKPTDIEKLEEQWISYTADIGITFSPSSIFSIKFIAEHAEVKFKEMYYDTSSFVNDYGNNLSVHQTDDKLFGILEYKPSVNNVIYVGARYQISNENQIRDLSKETLFFFKFVSNFRI